MDAEVFSHGRRARDLLLQLIDYIADFCVTHPRYKVLRRDRDAADGQRIFKVRNVDIGIVSLDDCFDFWLFLRHGARLGRRVDCANRSPTSAIRARIRHPHRQDGDCYDQYLVRMEEMRQSVNIMSNAASVYHRVGRAGRRTQGGAAEARRDERSMEALIHHFKLYTEGFTCRPARCTPRSKRPRASSASIWWPTAPTGPIAQNRAPGFVHLQAMDFLCRPYAGRRFRDARVNRHLLRRNRPLSGMVDLLFCGRCEGGGLGRGLVARLR